MFRRRSRTPDDDPVRRAAQYRVEREAAREAAEREVPDDDPARREPPGGAGTHGAVEARDDDAPVGGPRRVRPEDRAMYVDTVIDQAVRRGEFDDLPLAGKPIPGLTGTHDPDWWLKSVIEREQLTGLGPPAMITSAARGRGGRRARGPRS